MDSAPLVSVLIPCFNAEEYLEETINSVLSQTYEALEIIVIDDGSTDNSESILRRFSSRIKVHHHPGRQNLGQAAALNLGIEKSHGEFVAFLDADDLWRPEKIEKQVELLRREPDVGLVYTNADTIDTEGNFLVRFFGEGFQETNTPGEILAYCYIRTPSLVMARRELLQQVGGFNTELHSTDYDMWIRMSECTNFGYVPQSLTCYRRHENQKSQSRRQWEDGFTILNDALKRYPYRSRTKYGRRSFLYQKLAEFELEKGNRFRACGYYLMSGVVFPPRVLKNTTRLLFKA